jgi:hypothetical protein
MLGLVLFDHVVDWLLELLNDLEQSFLFGSAPKFASRLYKLYYLQDLERFVDVVSVSAGILGVILGLFYTAFLTLITTKYSNINSTIRSLIIEQKSINKYFVLLTQMTSLSILIQLAMSIGYTPSTLTAIALTLAIITTLYSFVGFGKYSLVYFDTGFLVNDILQRNYNLLNKLVIRKNEIERLNGGEEYLRRVYRNINTIQVLVEESVRLNSNPSLDRISTSLRKFLIFYTRVKYLIPTNDGWHIKTFKMKTWKNARDLDLDLLKSTGVGPLPVEEYDYNLIEKKVFEVQFLLFNHYFVDSDKVELLVNENEYLQIFSVQMELEMIKNYFGNLRKLIANKLSKTTLEDQLLRYNLIVVYSDLVKSILVGFNHNLPRITNKVLGRMSKATVSDKEVDFPVPYILRRWFDEFKTKLSVEKLFYNGIITPLFYPQFELSNSYQKKIQIFWSELASFFYNEIASFTNYLNKEEKKLESLALSISSMEIVNKMEGFTNTVNTRITELNEMNFQSEETPYVYDGIEELNGKFEKFKGDLLKNIIDNGTSSWDMHNERLPDLFGTSYVMIREEVINRLLQKDFNPDSATELLIKYLSYALLNLEKNRFELTDKNELPQLAKAIYPTLRDLMDIVSIAFVVSRLNQNDIILNRIFWFFNKSHESGEEEFNFWKLYYTAYEVFNHYSFTFSNSSYNTEFDRQTRLNEYLKETDLIEQIQPEPGAFNIGLKTYKSINNDLYIDAMLSSYGFSRFDRIELDEIFIEFFLRTRVYLKELEIKETRYGSKIRRLMEKKT